MYGDKTLRCPLVPLFLRRELSSVLSLRKREVRRDFDKN